jgi:hypothetical protein
LTFAIERQASREIIEKNMEKDNMKAIVVRSVGLPERMVPRRGSNEGKDKDFSSA